VKNGGAGARHKKTMSGDTVVSGEDEDWGDDDEGNAYLGRRGSMHEDEDGTVDTQSDAVAYVARHSKAHPSDAAQRASEYLGRRGTIEDPDFPIEDLDLLPSAIENNEQLLARGLSVGLQPGTPSESFILRRSASRRTDQTNRPVGVSLKRVDTVSLGGTWKKSGSRVLESPHIV
jgi:hypothetical protein